MNPLKKLIAPGFLAVVAVAVTLIGLPIAAAAAQSITLSERMRIRAQPASDASVIARGLSGDRLEVLSVRGEWSQVRHGHVVGWIKRTPDNPGRANARQAAVATPVAPAAPASRVERVALEPPVVSVPQSPASPMPQAESLTSPQAASPGSSWRTMVPSFGQTMDYIDQLGALLAVALLLAMGYGLWVDQLQRLRANRYRDPVATALSAPVH